MIECSNLRELRKAVNVINGLDLPSADEIFREVASYVAHQWLYEDDESVSMSDASFESLWIEGAPICIMTDADTDLSVFLELTNNGNPEIVHETLNLRSAEYMTYFTPSLGYVYVPKRFFKDKRWQDYLPPLSQWTAPILTNVWEF